MDNNIFSLDVTSEFAQAKTRLDEDRRFPDWLIDEAQGYALFKLDKDGHIIHWNRGAKRLTGYPAEEIIGQHFSRLFDCREMQLQKTPQFFLSIAGKQGFYESRGWWVHQDMHRFLAQVIIMHTDCYGSGFVVMVWDITNNKRATAELHGCPGSSPSDE